MTPTPRRIELPRRVDPRGALGFAEEGAHVPFPIRRVFFLTELPAGASRGGHAHRACHQLLVPLTGGCTAQLDDGGSPEAFRLDGPQQALHVPPGLWLELTAFAPGTTLLVLASERYDEADYLRARPAFEQFCRERG